MTWVKYICHKNAIKLAIEMKVSVYFQETSINRASYNQSSPAWAVSKLLENPYLFIAFCYNFYFKSFIARHKSSWMQFVQSEETNFCAIFPPSNIYLILFLSLFMSKVDNREFLRFWKEVLLILKSCYKMDIQYKTGIDVRLPLFWI